MWEPPSLSATHQLPCQGIKQPTSPNSFPKYDLRLSYHGGVIWHIDLTVQLRKLSWQPQKGKLRHQLRPAGASCNTALGLAVLVSKQLSSASCFPLSLFSFQRIELSSSLFHRWKGRSFWANAKHCVFLTVWFGNNLKLSSSPSTPHPRPRPPNTPHYPPNSYQSPAKTVQKQRAFFQSALTMCKPEQASGNIALLSETGIGGWGLLGGWALGGRHSSAYSLFSSPVVPEALLRQSPGPQVTEWELRMATGMMLCLRFLQPVGI